MLLPRPCLSLLALGLVTLSALADEYRLTANVTEAETGKVLRGVACALVRTGEKRAYARFVSPDYRGRYAVRAGDSLLVYRRGSDMARVLLEKGQRSADVALKPASRQCAINLAGADKEDVRLRISWWIEPIGDWVGKEPIVDYFHEDVESLPLSRMVPRGARVFAIVNAKDRIFWPRTSFVPEDGGRITLHQDAAWRPTFHIDPAGPEEHGPPSVAFLPDYSFVPPGPAVRVDAWKWRVTVAKWGRAPCPKDGQRLTILPPVPILALATVDGRTVARRFRPGDGAVDLRGPDPYRKLFGVPQVDRKPAPPGSFVLSGRHDVATVGALLASREEFLGMVLRLPEDRRGELPAHAELVPADWLTVWHPRFGLAHMRWPKQGIPSGSWYPGSMVIRAPEGWVFDGKIAGFPIWRGTGDVQTTPPVEELRRPVRGISVLRFDGLRPGWHSFDMRLDLVEPGTGRRHTVNSTHTVEISAEKPRHSYRLYSPDRIPPK